MKISKFPSLFFIGYLASISLFSNFSLSAQEKIDSTEYYGKAFLKPDKSSNLVAAFNFFEKSIEQNLHNKDTLKAIRNLRYLVIGQYEVGALYESEGTATRALRLLDKLPLDPSVTAVKIGLYNDLGMVYRALKNPENAFRFYNEALKICKNANDSMPLINNKGNLYSDMGNYELAEKQFTTVYEISLRNSDSLNQARALDNLGFTQSKYNNPEALGNMLHALQIRLRGNDLPGTYASYMHLGKYYHSRSQDEEALKYAQKGYEIAHRINSPSYIQNSLVNLLEIRKDPISREFIKLNDSIEQARLQKQNKYAGMQYDISKEKKKTEANRLLQEKEKRKKQGFQFLGLLLTLGIVAIYFIQRSQNRKNTIRQIYKTETRISKKVHDEVANDVYHLMTKIQLTVPESDILLDDLEGIYKKTRDISRENTDLNLQDDFGAQLTDLLQSYRQEGTVITVQNISKVNWKAISSLKKITVYRILQELMTNMKKHSKASQVLISFQKNRNKLNIQYIDNGVGCHLNSKNGLQNAENRIKAIGGRIIFETAPHKGFKITLTI